MGLFDRLFGAEPRPGEPQRRIESGTHRVAPPALTDAQALERYRYMVRTAPPETIEEAHAEAFERLTPEQRQQVLAALAEEAPPAEQAAARATSPDDPLAMGRLATRTEMRQPGFMERTLGGYRAPGLGGSLLGSFAMGFAGSLVAHSFFDALGGFEHPAATATADDTTGTDETAHATDADASVEETDTGDVDDGSDFDVGGDFDV